MQVALFRPHQRQRQAWVDRLRQSGYDIIFVHDPERMTEETDLIVIDTAVGKWKDYVRLLKGQGAPIVLLVDSDAQLSEVVLTSLGAVGTVMQEEETERVFAKFKHPKESGLMNRSEAETLDAFPQYGRSLVLAAEESFSMEPQQADLIRKREKESESTVYDSESEQGIQREKTMGSTLSQRKEARQRSAERSSAKNISEIHEDSALAPNEDRDNLVKGQQITTDEETAVTQGVPQSAPHSFPPKSRDLPSVAAVYSAKGGVGKTTFLLHLAALLAKEGRRVCVLDLDLMHGTVASMLQIQPNKTIVDLVRRIEDPKASRACLLQTKMGFSIVAAPLQPGAYRMQQEQLLAILRFLKEETDIVLIDTPVYFDSLIKLALEQAEQLLLMTTDEPASMEILMRMKPLLSSLRPTPELYMVWTRLTEQSPKEKCRENIPWPVILELPEDSTIGKAARSGQLIASSLCSPYRLRVKQLADRWLGMEPERPGDKRNLLMRVLFNRKSI